MLQELSEAVSRAAGLWAAVLPPMLLGCLAGNALASSRAGARCGWLCAPLARLAGLDGRCSTYLVLCFLNFNAANIYLASLVREGKAPKNGLLGIYLAGWLPASCHYYLFYFTPVLFPGLGARTASLVISVYFGASLCIFAVGAVLNRGTRKREPSHCSYSDGALAGLTAWPGWLSVLRRGIRQFAGIAAIFAPCVLALEILIAVAPVRSALDAIRPAMAWTGAPPASLLVAASALPSAMAGFAAAIACLRDGLLTPAQIPPTIMAAAMVHAVFSSFVQVLPANAAIFGPKTGAKLTFTSLGVRLPCLLLALAAAWAVSRG